ncbi:MAG: hypothetical protein IPK80_11255 [Nannocystis sp.]|nr:hypothetical protein [Nannocystis sp.]
MPMDDGREEGQVRGGAGAKVQAYCRALVADLPRGRLGCAIAEELLAGVPMAHRRRLPDVVGSAPSIFRALVAWGILPSSPSARVMSAALECVATVSPLVERRSPRLWVLRLSHFADDRSPLAQAVRRRIPNDLIEMEPAPDRAARPAGRRASRDERDRLAVELAASKREIERQQAALEEVRGALTAAEQAATVLQQQIDAAVRREALASEQSTKKSEQLVVERRRVEAAERRSAELERQGSDALKKIAASEERADALEEELHEQRMIVFASEATESELMGGLARAEEMVASATEEARAATTRAAELERKLEVVTTAAAEAKTQSQSELAALRKELVELRKVEYRQAERIKTLELLSSKESWERATIVKALGMSTYDDRVMIDVFNERMSALDSALGELRALRKILRVGPQDQRPLQEILEAELRSRATGQPPSDPQRR